MTRPLHTLPFGVLEAESRAALVTLGNHLFPRASESPGRYPQYAHDCRTLMMRWLGQNPKLADFDDVFGLSPSTECDALMIALDTAATAICRPLNANEVKLLKSCVRDHVIIKTALRLATELRATAEMIDPATGGRNRHLAASAACDSWDLADRLQRGEA